MVYAIPAGILLTGTSSDRPRRRRAARPTERLPKKSSQRLRTDTERTTSCLDERR